MMTVTGGYRITVVSWCHWLALMGLGALTL
jgi:hypothetical protein